MSVYRQSQSAEITKTSRNRIKKKTGLKLVFNTILIVWAYYYFIGILTSD